LTPAVKMLLVLNALVFLFLTICNERLRAEVIQILGLVPILVTREFALWQPVTYAFIHAGFLHLLLNMLQVWWFGVDLERLWGTKKFLTYYFFTAVGGAAAAVAMSPSSAGATIGASGAIFGVLVAFGMLFPNRVIYIYFVLPVKAKYLVIGMGLLTFFSLMQGPNDGVSHIAHLGGLAFGLIWFAYEKSGFNVREFYRGLQRRRMRRRLKVVKPQEGNKDDPFSSYDKKTLH